MNNNGGDATVTDFSVTTDAGALSFDAGVGSDPVVYTADTLTVDANTEYSLSESDVTGYTEGTWSCDGANSAGNGGQFDDSSITLDLGETVTCEITNDDVAPELIIVKNVMNGVNGTATVTDFSVTTNAGALSFDGGVGSDPVVYTADTLTVDANTEYSLSESDVESYAEGTWSCTNGDGGAYDAGTVTLDEGETVTCEITNEYAELEIVKGASPKSYSAVGDEIVYTVTATNTGVATLTNVDISDDLIDGLDDWTCVPGNPVATLASGESIVCTATYTITQADIDAGQVFNQACVDSDETPEVCDDVTVWPISVVIVKTPDQDVVTSGDKVTFTLDFSHPSPFSVYAYSLVDDVFGDLFDADNPNSDIVSNECVSYAGVELLPETWYHCDFTAKVYGTTKVAHVNTVTITVTDLDPLQGPTVIVPRFATASDDATVKFKGGGGSGGGGGQPPTDMLLTTDTIGVADEGTPFGGPLNWAIWVLLSVLLILSTGWVIRHQRFAEVKNR